MTQQRIIRGAMPAAGGYQVEVEITAAYTDGRSRFERVYLSTAELRGKTPEQKRQAILDALDDDPMDGVAGVEVSAPTVTKGILEDRMEALYADWQRWKNTRLEAQARAIAAAAVTALTNREDAAWTKYLQAIQAWRTAP